MSTAVITAAAHDNNQSLSGNTSAIIQQTVSMQNESMIQDQSAPSGRNNLKVISTGLSSPGVIIGNLKHSINENNQLRLLGREKSIELSSSNMKLPKVTSHTRPDQGENKKHIERDYSLPQHIFDLLTEVAKSGSSSLLPWNESIPELLSQTPISSQVINPGTGCSDSEATLPSSEIAFGPTLGQHSTLQRNGLKKNHSFIFPEALESGRKRPSLEDDQLHAIQKSKRRLLSQQLDSFGFEVHCLRDVFRISIGQVLDRFHHKVGYKLSPAETWVNADSEQSSATDNGSNGAQNGIAVDRPTILRERNSDYFFKLRRNRIMQYLDIRAKPDHDTFESHTTNSTLLEKPPFTIQRIAEVLLSPDRFYTQTHKLCNSLEKLLLVSASSSAFGGSVGGNNLQNRKENDEITALADEIRRQQLLVGQKRRHGESNLHTSEDNIRVDRDDGKDGMQNEALDQSTEDENDTIVNDGADSFLSQHNPNDTEMTPREIAEAAARASLRTKFDHISVESPIQMATCTLEGEGRVRASSPPPPMCGGTSPLTLPGPHSGILRNHSPGPSSPTSPDRKDLCTSSARNMSPLLFGNLNMSSEVSSPPLSSRDSPHHSPSHVSYLSMNAPPFDLSSLRPSIPGGNVLTARPRDYDFEHRSPASSDLDSESDVSLDDSTSDRSEGSNSGQYNEPSNGTRVAIRNQHLPHSRILSASVAKQKPESERSDSA
jgi:PPP4R2